MRPTPFLALIGLLFSFGVQADGFPGRHTYPHVKVYETDQLNQEYDNVDIVDARSTFEYEVLHINKAKNIPLHDRAFTKKVRQLQKDGKPIVFYCNGHTCYKSYKAAKRARIDGIRNVFAYDAGIFDWARAHPEKATLLGHTPVDPDKLISKADLKKHLLSPKAFNDKITDETLILDIREPAQRGLLELFPYRQESISMGETQKLRKFLMATKKSGRPLMVYDEVGKQVRWLQYYLQDIGIKNYYFLQGGVKNFFKSLKN